MNSHDSSRTEPPSPPAKDWRSLSDRLTTALKPTAPRVAISFLSEAQAAPAARLSADYAPPNAEGRTGQVPAGCVFWIKGATATFSTTATDHANCSVGSLTHGFLTLEEAASRDDVCAVLESGWVDLASVKGMTRVTEKPHTIVYGPLADTSSAPDVVLLRINGFALMTLKDALPGLRIEGKPQCHIVAIAKEQGEVAASVGCALSRARTGMRPEEMTCAIPGNKLAAVVEAIEAAVALDRMMAGYAADDARRFRTK
jgi:uncharacterized protein (DUF169 family)